MPEDSNIVYVDEATGDEEWNSRHCAIIETSKPRLLLADTRIAVEIRENQKGVLTAVAVLCIRAKGDVEGVTMLAPSSFESFFTHTLDVRISEELADLSAEPEYRDRPFQEGEFILSPSDCEGPGTEWIGAIDALRKLRQNRIGAMNHPAAELFSSAWSEIDRLSIFKQMRKPSDLPKANVIALANEIGLTVIDAMERGDAQFFDELAKWTAKALGARRNKGVTTKELIIQAAIECWWREGVNPSWNDVKEAAIRLGVVTSEWSTYHKNCFLEFLIPDKELRGRKSKKPKEKELSVHEQFKRFRARCEALRDKKLVNEEDELLLCL